MSFSKITLALSFTIAMLISSAQTSLGQFIDPNPVVVDGGKQYKLRYDPFSGRMRLDSSHSKVRESYFDPNRNNVDPGSYEQVNEYQMDENGVRWHVTGTRWTSGGRPHSNLKRTRSTPWGNENEYVASSVPNGKTGQPSPTTPTRPRQPSKPGIWPGHSTNPVRPIVGQPTPVRPTAPQNRNPIRQIIRQAPQGGISIPGIFGR